jgi:TetR/AcrR family transcriptional repressor of bet genes
MEPIRRRALVEATIEVVGAAGSLDVTVSQIAKRAGMSSGLAHHYFGGKDQILLAAMHHILKTYGVETRAAVARTADGLASVTAIVETSFDPEQFGPSVIRAWMSFYGMAQTSEEARRLLLVYQSRLRCNLSVHLRAAFGSHAPELAEQIASMIDGRYLRLVATRQSVDHRHEAARIMELVTPASGLQ